MTPHQRELLVALRGLSRVFEKHGFEKKAAMSLAADTLTGLRKQAVEPTPTTGGTAPDVGGGTSWWGGLSPAQQWGIGGGVAGLGAGALYDRLRPRERWEGDPTIMSTLRAALFGGAAGGAAGGLYGRHGTAAGKEYAARAAEAADRYDSPETIARNQAQAEEHAKQYAEGQKISKEQNRLAQMNMEDPNSGLLPLVAGGAVSVPTAVGLSKLLGGGAYSSFAPYAYQSTMGAAEPVAEALSRAVPWAANKADAVSASAGDWIRGLGEMPEGYSGPAPGFVRAKDELRHRNFAEAGRLAGLNRLPSGTNGKETGNPWLDVAQSPGFAGSLVEGLKNPMGALLVPMWEDQNTLMAAGRPDAVTRAPIRGAALTGARANHYEAEMARQREILATGGHRDW